MERHWVSGDCKTGGTGVGLQGGGRAMSPAVQGHLQDLLPAAGPLPCLWVSLSRGGAGSWELGPERSGDAAVRAGEVEGHRHPVLRKPTCFGRHFQEVAVQVDVEVRRPPGQRDARAIPAHGQVLLEAHGARAQHQVHRLGPGEGAGPAGVVLHQHLEGRGRGGAVFRQNVLTRPLKVKCPSVKSVVVGISEHRANAGLCGWVRDKSRVTNRAQDSRGNRGSLQETWKGHPPAKGGPYRDTLSKTNLTPNEVRLVGGFKRLCQTS